MTQKLSQQQVLMLMHDGFQDFLCVLHFDWCHSTKVLDHQWVLQNCCMLQEPALISTSVHALLRLLDASDELAMPSDTGLAFAVPTKGSELRVN